MVRVALVGNIASGKSVVEQILLSLGYEVLDTDKVCHKLLVELHEVKEFFKDYNVFENGIISREKLGQLVFNQPELRKKLEKILYPELKKEIIKFNSVEKVTFTAIPLLFESGMTDLFDKVIFIYCADDVRLERLINRNNYSVEYAKTRMNSQMSQDEKVKKSDYIIYNNSTIEDLEQAVRNVLAQIR